MENSEFETDLLQESPCGMVAHVPNYEIVVSKFKLQSSFHVSFQNKSLGKGGCNG